MTLGFIWLEYFIYPFALRLCYLQSKDVFIVANRQMDFIFDPFSQPMSLDWRTETIDI